jgi:hypothetical protein
LVTGNGAPTVTNAEISAVVAPTLVE